MTSDLFWFSYPNLVHVLCPLVPHYPSVVLWCCVTGFSSPSAPVLHPLCLPCVLLYPTPVLLMACQPCRGAGRIWCCRSHKVRPWGWGGPGFLSLPLALGGLCRNPPVYACAWCVPNVTWMEAVIPGTRLDPCPGSPSHLFPAFYPFLVIPFLWLLGLATLSFCLSQHVPVCFVSGKRMSCPDSGNAQSIEISGHGGLGPWLFLEEGDSGR